MGNEFSIGGKSADPGACRINFVGARLTEMPKELIHAKKNKLEALNLTCNQIAGVVDIGQHPALQALILWGNRITSLNFTGAALSRLKVLDLGNNDLREFPAGLAKACPNLTDLNLSGNNMVQNNKLESLPESIMTLTELKCLLAHGNAMKSLPPIRHCQKLEELQLNENQIEELDDDVFLGLNALHTLDLTGNKLRRLPGSVWQLKMLKVLRAGRNELVDLGLGPYTLEPLVALDSVLLCNNKLREVPAALLHCWAYVVTLDLRYNQIEELPASLAPLAGVDTLHLGFNKLQNVPEDIKALPKLTELHLNNNRLSDNSAGLESLGRCVGMRTLNLAFNSLTQCPPAISRLPFMNSLNLAGNKLTNFDLRCAALSSSVANPFALRIILDLSYNELGSFPSCIYNMAALEEIRLFGNRLTTLPDPERLASKLPQLKVVSLSVDVPDRDVAAFCDSLRRHGNQIIRIYIDNRYGCVAWETENVHRGERGLFQEQHAQAAKDTAPLALTYTHAGLAQITGTASHAIEDRVVVGHIGSLDMDCFGLFDGHAGDTAANAAKHAFPIELERLGRNGVASDEVMRLAYHHVNEAVRARIAEAKNPKVATCGSTSVVALCNRSAIVCGNAGDSRAILVGRDGDGGAAMTLLSTNHNPGYREEWDRVRAAGGYVTERVKPGGLIVEGCRLVVPRDDGGFQSLGVSRSLGDFHCAPSLSGEPSVSVKDISAGDEYLVLCSDGITDVITEQEVAAFVLEAVRRATAHDSVHVPDEYEKEKEAADQPEEQSRAKMRRTAMLSVVGQWLCLHARSLGSIDDVTAIVVELNASA